jgi:hypothetical protein
LHSSQLLQLISMVFVSLLQVLYYMVTTSSLVQLSLVLMLSAVAGYLVQENGIRLPGDIDYSGTSFESIPNGFAA